MADKHNVDLRPYMVTDFEAVADLWTRVNRELAPAGMEALFERYIATTIEGELSRLLGCVLINLRRCLLCSDTDRLCLTARQMSRWAIAEPIRAIHRKV